MRFVNLKKKLRYTTCYERISSLGCGPNFVLNRLPEFKTMIKDQGVKFWFRFWLNFSFHPEIIEEPLCVNCHTIDVMRILCGLIHKNFLEGSPKDTINYCLNIFTNVMSEINDEKIEDIKTVKEETMLELEEQNNSLSTFLEFLFGCSLCEVFFVWLEANQVDSKSNYWSPPDLYLNFDFQPRLIEHYFVHAWGVRILHLLGVNQEAIPWIRTLLKERKTVVKFDLDEIIDCESEAPDDSSYREIECWDKKLEVMKARLFTVDEFRNEEKKELEEPRKINVQPAAKTVNKTKKTVPRCSFCFNTDSFITKLKKCSLCVSDKTETPHYYCGVSCQTEDWFRNHAKDHFTVSPFMQIKPGMIEKSTENQSKLFTASLFDN